VLNFKEAALKSILNIPDNYDIAMVLVMGYPDESPVAEAAAGSLESHVDEKIVRRVPKRKLAEILYKNKFA
jgi:hypothetical protein